MKNLHDEERIRHENVMTMLKTKKDKEAFAPRFTEVKNDELVENNKHREKERNLGQLKRDCAIEERMERRTQPR